MEQLKYYAIIFLLLFYSCDTRRSSIGADNELMVFASDKHKSIAESFLQKIFNDTIFTPQPEPVYKIKFAKPVKFSKLKRQSNLVILSLGKDLRIDGTKLTRNLLGKKKFLETMSNDNHIIISENQFAKNQLFMIISAPDEQLLMESLRGKEYWIKSLFEEKYDRRQGTYLFGDARKNEFENRLMDRYSWNIKIPWGWEKIKEDPDSNLLWLGKEFPYQWFCVSWRDQPNRPVIYDFGIFTILGKEIHLAIYSYGFMLVVAFYTCFFLLQKEFKRIGIDIKVASDIVFFAAVGGIVGSKIYYLIENFGRVLEDPIGMIFSGSGLVFLGGLMGGTLGVTWVIQKQNLNWLKMSDIVAPLLILGYGIGRVGCFLVGDDYGIPTHLPWGILFENGLPPTTYQSFQYNYPWISLDGFEPGLLSVYPTQLMETALALCIFGYLWSQREKISFDGQLFFTYLILAGLERFSIEFIRTNVKYFSGLLTGSQIISIFMILIGIYFLWFNRQLNVPQPSD